jgi:hypothetical protein
MFGSPTGFRTYDKDQADLAQMAQQRKLIEAQTTHQNELAQLNKAQAAAIGRKAAMDEKRSTAISAKLSTLGQGGTSTAGSLRDRLTQVANVGIDLFEADPDQAAKMVKASLDGLKEIEQTDYAAEQVAGKRLDQTIARTNYIEEVLSGVNSPETHARAMMVLRGSPLTASMKLPKEITEYNQANINAALAGSKALREKAKAARDAAESRAQINNVYDQIKQRQIRTGLEAKRVEIAEDRATNLGKVEVEPPTKQLTSQDRAITQRLLKEQGIKFSDDENGTVVDQLAEEAKREIALNPSKPFGVALSQAIGRAVSNGDLQKGTRVLGMGTSDKFTAREGTIRMPLPMPASRNPADLEVGRFYIGAKGQIGQYLGNGDFEPVAKRFKKVEVTK